MAGGAGALEDGATVREVGGGEGFVGELAFELGDVGIFVGGGRGERAPEVNERRSEHARKLAGVEGGDVAFWNVVVTKGGEER